MVLSSLTRTWTRRARTRALHPSVRDDDVAVRVAMDIDADFWRDCREGEVCFS